MRPRLYTPIRYFSAFLFVAAAACRDADTPAASTADPRPALTVAADGALRDDEIDLRDTYFAFNVTTTRTVEAGGAAGEPGIASLESEEYATDESVYLEAGFGGDGALRFNVYSDGAADERHPAPPPVVRTVGNNVYVYDEWGNLVEASTFNDFLEGVGLPGGDLAVGSPYGVLYKPLGSYGGGGGGGGEPINVEGVDPRRTRVNRVRDDVLQVTTSSGDAADVWTAARGGASIQATRTFRRRNVPTAERSSAGTGDLREPASAVPHWVLESVEQTATVPRNGRIATVRTRTTYRYVVAHINRGRDERREKVPGADRAAPARAQHAAPAEGPQNVSAASIDGINLCERGQANHTRTVTSGGGGVVYQHGFCSNADTWSAMRQRVPETHRVGLEQTYSLNSDAPIESQVTDLASRLSAVGAGGNVVVSHSQGGLVARRLGQRRPDLVSGVVTIGTPHEGALIASRPASVIADALHEAIDDPCFGTLCTLGFEVGEAVAAGLITHGVGELVPAAGDDQPGSALIQRVNGRSEYQYETFRRVSIAMNVSPRWALFRMIGDARTSRSRLLAGEPLKGRGYARDAQRLYDAARVLRYMAVALRWQATAYGSGWGCHQSGYAYYWEPCYNYNYHHNWWEASYWYHIADALHHIGVSVAWTMDFIDRTWDNFTTGRVGGTDGFVQLASQHYPTYVPGAFPIRHFPIDGFEAHSGETASTIVLDRLRFALDEAGLRRY